MKRGLYLILIYVLIFRAQQKNKEFFESGKIEQAGTVQSSAPSFAVNNLGSMYLDKGFHTGPADFSRIRAVYPVYWPPTVKKDMNFRKKYLAIQ